MKILLPDTFSVNLRQFLRRNGYASHLQTKLDRLSFVKRVTSDDFPRFHIYIEKDIRGKNYLTLHLDQKKPSYDGAHAHSGEYDGDLVRNESQALQKSIFQTHTLIQNDHEVNSKKNLFQRLFHG